MKYIVKGIKLLLIAFLLGQYLPTTVEAIEFINDNLSIQNVSPLYTYKAEADPNFENEFLKMQNEFSHEDYVVQQPFKVFFYEEDLNEIAYYPIVSDQHLIGLVYQNLVTGEYDLESSEIVEQFSMYKFSATNQVPITLIKIGTELLGKTSNVTVNFSSPQKTNQENESLLSQVDFSHMNFGQVTNIYEQTNLLFEKMEVNNQESDNLESLQLSEQLNETIGTTETDEKVIPSSLENKEERPEKTDDTDSKTNITPEKLNDSQNRNVKEQQLDTPLVFFNQDIPGEFSGDGKDIYYQVNIPNYQPDSVNEEYVFSLTGSNATGSILELYDASKKHIASARQLQGYTSTFTKKLEPGTYYVKTAGYYSTKTGSYTLRVDRSITKHDANNSFGTAEPLDFNQELLGSFEHIYNDQDYYRIEVPTYHADSVNEEYVFS
ncbi:hypothetical protein I6N95_15355, partial [Vagococcus sp. BWB3-3]